MIKLNFRNHLKGDDELLIRLLKEHSIESPSNDFEENTIKRFEAIKAENRFGYKPLKTPLYFMVVIIILLVLPLAIPTISNSMFLGQATKLLSYPAGIVLEYVIWSWLFITIVWIAVLITPSHLKFNLSQHKP